MKKVKTLFSGIAVIVIVGSALALTGKSNPNLYTTDPILGTCTKLVNYRVVLSGCTPITGEFSTVRNATAACPQQTICVVIDL